MNCSPCEAFLRSRDDKLWSATIADIPETPDETSSREDWDKRGAQDRDAIMPLLLAKLAGVDPSQLPESLTRAIAGTSLHIPGQIECPKGHLQPSGQDFCGKCGSPMRTPAATGSLPAGGEREATASPPADDAAGPDLGSLHVAKLKAMARQQGLDPSGSKADVLARLEAAA